MLGGAAAAAAFVASPWGAAQAAPAPAAVAACPAATAGVRFDLASAILRAAYEGFDAAVASGAPGAEGQRGGEGAGAGAAATSVTARRASLSARLAELRRREYPYYLFEGPTREGERARPGYVAPPPPGRYAAEVEPLLAALEEGQQQGVGPTPAAVPPPIFDFAVWSLFKAIAAELPPSQAVGGARSELNAACGRALARAVAGEQVEELRRLRKEATSLGRTVSGGGETTGAERASSSSAAAGVAAAGVAPFTAVAAALETAMARLADGGYCCSWQVTYGEQPGSWPYDWITSEPRVVGDAAAESARAFGATGASGGGAGGSKPLLLQLRVARPADVGASVALRNEDWGFAPRLVSGLFASLLEAAGYGALVGASIGARSPPVVDAADVYYAQDAPMRAPSSLRDRLLLALGDPMTEVVVSFTPETEVADWAVVVPPLPPSSPGGAGVAGEAGGRVVATSGG